MFDEKQPSSSNPVEDMFADAGKVPLLSRSSVSAGIPQGVPQQPPRMGSGLPPQPGMPPMPPMPGSLPPQPLTMPPRRSGGKWVIILVVVLAIGVAGVGGWFLYQRYFAQKQPVTGSLQNFPDDTYELPPGYTQNLNGNKGTKNSNVNTSPISEEPAEPRDKDTDADGLSDADEAKYGTNEKNVDSDDDGLFDNEEVRIYNTDPLNRDTDKDGYVDSEEVEKGYNPKGPGKLFEIPKEK